MSPVEAAALGIGEVKLREFVTASIAGSNSDARNRLREFVIAARVGGIPPKHALAFLRDVPAIADHFALINSGIEDIQEEIISEIAAAPGEVANDFKTAAAAYDRAIRASDKADADAVTARQTRVRTFERLNGLQKALENQVGARSLTLELLADPVFDKTIHVLNAEFQAMHVAPPFMWGGRFAHASKPDAKLRRLLRDQQDQIQEALRPVLERAGMQRVFVTAEQLDDRIKLESEAMPPADRLLSGVDDRSPQLRAREPLAPPGFFGQTSSYMEGLLFAIGALESAKLLGLAKEAAAAFVERVLASIPYRDPAITFVARGLSLENPSTDSKPEDGK